MDKTACAFVSHSCLVSKSRFSKLSYKKALRISICSSLKPAIMKLNDQRILVEIHKKLASALMKRPSPSCKNCKILTEMLADVAVLYSNILDGVIKKEIRWSFARHLLGLIVDVVKTYTKGS